MLTIQNLSFTVDDKLILDSISEVFEPGKLTLIIGPNGAGKSTLIKAICGQLKLAEKNMVSYGNPHFLTISELAKIRAVLSQNIEIGFPLTVKELVMMGRYPHHSNYPSEKDKTACTEAMQFFDLMELADRNYLTLSGGEKQRVQFARVLAQIWFPPESNLRYLIMDEPLTFLDVHYQYNFMYKMEALARNNDIVIIGVLHDLNLTAKFADKIILINNGKIEAVGNKKQVLTVQNILKAYKIEPKIHEIKDEFFINF